MIHETDVRDPTLLEFATHAPETADGWHCRTARGQTFRVDWVESTCAGARYPVASAWEAMVIVADTAVTVHRDGIATEAGPESVVIVPAGRFAVETTPGAPCAVITSLSADAAVPALNADAYREADKRILPCTPAYRTIDDADRVRVLPIASVPAPADKPRLKMLQTSTLSINWVQYEGPRNRSALSPHAHGRFEQGSLGIRGRFVHHLRVEWGADANQWQDDRHVGLDSPSLMVVPVRMIHTSEGVGAGSHLLIDIFSPPRADFRAKGWIANAADYEAPVASSAQECRGSDRRAVQ